MISLYKLLRLQVVYYFLGMLFNLVSIYYVETGQPQLTPNEPKAAAVFMTIYACFLISGFVKWIGVYRILMVVSVVLMGYGGVFNHINHIQNTPELYASFTAGLIGIGINIYGLILNIIAAAKKFH